jgi:ribosomal protein L11 methyltransferase
MSPIYKAVFKLNAASAEALMTALEESDPTPGGVLAFEEPDIKTWTVEAIYTVPPDAAALQALSKSLIRIETLPDVDWVKRSLESLPPIRAGRFFVSGAHDRHKAPGGATPILIEAGQAFGTGSHPTTRGCLLAIDALAKRRRFRNPLDLGCGSGVLAFAMAQAFAVPVLGCDIDPIAVETARGYARANGLARRVRLIAANGLAHPQIAARAPFDLIAANILAGPLRRIARPVCAALAPNGTLILSGLLAHQEAYVRTAYQAQGLKFCGRHIIEDWVTLRLSR